METRFTANSLLLVQRRVRLGDAELVLRVGGQVFDLIGDKRGDEDDCFVQLLDLRQHFSGDALAFSGDHFARLRVGQRLAQLAADQTRIVG